MALVACPECASQVSDQATACPKCGHPVAGPSVPQPAAPPSYGGPPLAQKNATASLSMWLGIASFITVGLAGVPALVLGLKAKREIGAQPGRFANAGQATAGVVLGGIGTAMLALFLVAAIRGGRGKPTASTGASASSASDAPQNDSRFPIGDTVQVGKCKFDVKDVIVAHGDEMYNWAVTAVAFATMKNDVATEGGIEP